MSDDPKWLQWRREGVTATDVADAAAGTYGGMYGVVARKLGHEVVEQTEQMSRGLRWEQPIADMVHLATGLYVVGEQAWVECTTDHRWRCTIDGLLSPWAEASIEDCVGVLETKTIGLGVQPNRDRWALQCQWQMMCTGMPLAIIAEGCIDDSDDSFVSLKLRQVEADTLLQEDLVAIAEDIWAHMQNQTLPDPDVASALPVVKAVYSTAVPTAEVVDLNSDDVLTFHLLKSEAKDRQEELDLIEARIRDAMGLATKGAVDGYKVSLSEPARKLTAEREAELLETHPEYAKTVLDRERVKSNDKALYESFQTRAGARALRVTPPKEK